MLREFGRIIDDASNKIDADELMAVAARLRERQFIFKEGRGTGRTYDVLINQRDYFESLFQAFGDEFIVDQRFGFVGIIPRSSKPVLTQLETIFLLLLAKMHDVECRKARALDGRTNEDILLDEYRELTGRDKPRPAESKAALQRLRRAGIIELGPISELTEMHEITILPSITRVITESYLTQLENFTGSTSTEGAPETDEMEVSDAEGDNE